jgi:hypothetical protein
VVGIVLRIRQKKNGYSLDKKLHDSPSRGTRTLSPQRHGDTEKKARLLAFLGATSSS